MDFPSAVQSAVVLLGEIAGSVQPLEWRRRHLMQGLSGLIGADVWAWVHLRMPDAGMGAAFRSLDGGYVDLAERARWIEAGNNADGAAVMQWAHDSLNGGRGSTKLLSKQAESTPADGESNPIQRYQSSCRDVGLGDQILSFYPLDGQTVSMIGFQRRTEKPTFAEIDRQLIHLVVGQIDWLHREASGVAANEDRLLSLTPRERQLLLLELGGTPRKLLADSVGISQHTVGDHFKSIYRKLGVRSRAELLARFISPADE